MYCLQPKPENKSKSDAEILFDETKIARMYTSHSAMLQLKPNWSELRSMDCYHQIFCRFRNVSEKFLHRPPSVLKNHPLPPQRKIFLILWGGKG